MRLSYKQSLWAVQHAEGLFEAASLPFKRPNDYFAEMLKTDAHMSLIRQKLLDEAAGIKASEDARKLRDAKKFGKKVQVERLKEREKDKKEVGKRLESLKKSASSRLPLPTPKELTFLFFFPRAQERGQRLRDD